MNQKITTIVSRIPAKYISQKECDNTTYYHDCDQAVIFSEDSKKLNEESADYAIFERDGKWELMYYVIHSATRQSPEEYEDKYLKLESTNLVDALKEFNNWLVDQELDGYYEFMQEQQMYETTKSISI